MCSIKEKGEGDKENEQRQLFLAAPTAAAASLTNSTQHFNVRANQGMLMDLLIFPLPIAAQLKVSKVLEGNESSQY